MAEILGLGLTHYPGPLVPTEFWPGMIQRNVNIGRVPQDVFDDKASWPEGMLAEWGDDEGVSAAEEHATRLMSSFKKLRQELDDFNPDIVLIWGDDQYENFKTDCVPAFGTYIFDELICKPYNGGVRPFEADKNHWGKPADEELVVNGHAEASRELAADLIGNGFDIAYSYSTRAPAGLAHSFNNTILFLDYELGGFPYPVIPFYVNCYGSQLLTTAAMVVDEDHKTISPPSPTPKRCFEIGRATAKFFADSPWRVALIASSSWSHGSLTAKHNRLYPDIPADRRRYDELSSGGYQDWASLSVDEINDAGQNEILNWVCLAGAMTETGQQFQAVDFIESYVFNSSKCFCIFPSQ